MATRGRETRRGLLVAAARDCRATGGSRGSAKRQAAGGAKHQAAGGGEAAAARAPVGFAITSSQQRQRAVPPHTAASSSVSLHAYSPPSRLVFSLSRSRVSAPPPPRTRRALAPSALVDRRLSIDARRRAAGCWLLGGPSALSSTLDFDSFERSTDTFLCRAVRWARSRCCGTRLTCSSTSRSRRSVVVCDLECCAFSPETASECAPVLALDPRQARTERWCGARARRSSSVERCGGGSQRRACVLRWIGAVWTAPRRACVGRCGVGSQPRVRPPLRRGATAARVSSGSCLPHPRSKRDH